VVPEGAEGLEHDEDADAIVHRLAQVVAADLLQRAVHRHVVADAHGLLDLLGRHAEVHVELLGLGSLLVPVLLEVRRLARGLQGAAQRRAARGRDDDALGDHVRWVVPAQGLEPDEALIVDVPDQEADLVHVRGDHNAPIIPPPLRADDAAQRVGADLVRQRTQLLAGDLALPVLPTRHAGRLDELPE
jgi:hypothetical protein